MANQAIRAIDPPGQLQTESLRFTVFLAPSEKIGEQRWWPELTGAEPEVRNSRPALGQLQEAGPFHGCGLVLAIGPGRVDWILTPRQQEGVPAESRWAGPLVETLPFFLELMERWLESAPVPERLALGAVVHQPMPDRQSAYRRLAQFLHAVEIDPEGSSEFAYQVNRPRKSRAVEGLQINRLSKWSATLLVPFGLSFIPPGGAHLGKLGDGETTCRIELDINTDPEYKGDLNHALSSALLKEFVDMAMEIVTAGETP